MWSQRLDTNYLFLQHQGDEIVGWYCEVGTAMTQQGSPISGRGRSFTWTLPWTPPGQMAAAAIQSADSIVVSYGSSQTLREFRRATFDPPRIGPCNTTIAMPGPR